MSDEHAPTPIKSMPKIGSEQRHRPQGPVARPRKSPAPSGERPRVGLALAGGFARGIAHVGVIRALRNAGVPIDMRCRHQRRRADRRRLLRRRPAQRHAADRVRSTTFADFGRWTPSWLGLANNLRLERYLQRFTPAKTFEELTTPFAIAATDINAGVTVYYTRGLIGPSASRLLRLSGPVRPDPI